MESYVSKEQLVTRVPNFGYQLQFAGPEVEEKAVGRDGIRGFLSVLYGARGKGGEQLFNPANGVKLDSVVAGEVGESPLLSKEEMDFYASEYERNGLRGPLNWYRTWEVNYEEERKLVEEKRNRVTVPALMVMASRDVALPPAMAAAMDQYCDDLVKREVNASHWALWETPAETNQHIGEFLDVILKDKRAVKASI
jgi:pimeloyl-ACP methyl ester carboxylesterase